MSAAWATDAAIELIRREWAAGTSGAQIARMVGCSKNALLGKVRRLKLDYREVPRAMAQVWTADLDAELTLLVAQGETNGRIGVVMGIARWSVRHRVSQLGLTGTNSRRHVVRRVEATSLILAVNRSPQVAPPSRPARMMIPVRVEYQGECCWPIGEPGSAAFRWCDEPAIRGRPYCDEHSAKAHVRREQPAAQQQAMGGDD